MRLLLAEDERDMSNVLTTILKHSGYEVDLAENGQEALDLSMKNNYDCMVMDIMMPVMDGLTALKILRSKGDVTPVILLTAKSEIDDRISGLDSGADDKAVFRRRAPRPHPLAHAPRTGHVAIQTQCRLHFP